MKPYRLGLNVLGSNVHQEMIPTIDVLNTEYFHRN